MTRTTIAAIVLATAAAAQPAPEAQHHDTIAAPHRLGAGSTQRRLTLQQAVEIAIRSNLDVAIERANVDDAGQAIRGARGAFDPAMHWQSTAGDSNTPAPSVLQGADGILSQHNAGQTVSWQQKTPWNGLNFSAEFDASRITSANPFVSLTPFYTTQLAFTVTQPLVRGRAIDADRALIIIRRRNRDASAAELEARAIDVAAQVERSYWDLVAARRRVDVDLDAANLAKTQFEQNRRMIAAGSLPPVELSASEAELQARLDDLYRSTGDVTEVEDNLKSLLARDRHDGLWDEEIIPTDDGAATQPGLVELSEATSQALAHRPELKQIAANAAANEVSKQQNADQLKPQINLVANYTLAGLAGRVQSGADPFTSAMAPVYQRLDALSAQAGLPPLPQATLGALPGSVSGGLGGSLSNLFNGHYQTVQAGFTLDFTVHNRTAAANLESAAIAGKRLELMRARAEQAIEAQVRDALQALDTARQRVRAANAGERAAGDKLSSETRLFAAGESTNFLVLTRQNEFLDARLRCVDAETALWKAVSRYQAALGTTLSGRGIEVE